MGIITEEERMEGYCVIKCKLTYVTDLLGSACNDPDLHGSYIASLAPDARSRKEEAGEPRG